MSDQLPESGQKRVADKLGSHMAGMLHGSLSIASFSVFIGIYPEEPGTYRPSCVRA